MITNLTRVARSIGMIIVLAWGWRRAAIAFAAGAVSAAAMAPINAWPLLFLTFPILVLLIDGAAAGRLGGLVGAGLAGWWFGFGYFLAGLYWVGIAFLVDAKTFGWLMPFGVIALPAGLALFTAFGTALARLLWSRGAIRIVALALALTSAEWLRGHLLSGFPWNAFGYALTTPLALGQAAAFVGLWGLTFFAVYLFASPAGLFDDRKTSPYRSLNLSIGIATLIMVAAFGALRLDATPTALVPGVHLRIMQPNVTQDDKYNYAAKQQIMNHYLALSDRATGPDATGVKDVTHLIWPESPFPFILAREADALAQIATLLNHTTVLITGGVRILDAPPGGKGFRAYNSIYVIDRDGTFLGVYDKIHLVPFGEYLPFQAALERIGLTQLTKLPGGFSTGDRRRTMVAPGAPAFLPLICYEIVFPDEAVPRSERPHWLLNLTNDGWFGDSSGPYQHLQQARMRAIEQGLPLVRGANTGISAVIDPVGRIVGALPLGVEGVLDAPLPQPIAPTFYLRFGDAPLAMVLAAALVLVLRSRWRSRGSKRGEASG